MLNKKTKNRSFLFFLFFLSLIIIISTTLKVLEDNVLYFLSPTEIYEKNNLKFNEKIRIGGMVKKESITVDNKEIKFILTDFKNEIIVIYKGTVPNLFAEGKGVVAEGTLKDKKFFVAKQILAKHDENYMPPKK
jgi:Cytochrome c-type biogenesis protein CcmE|tara:strand:+ start:123 stop:524 length:402 start_codon:yes stop_codon:yes gene_type:complete